MRVLTFRYTSIVNRFASDVDRIVEVCLNAGYYLSKADAQYAWEEYSDSLAACWLSLPDNNKILDIVLGYCEIIEL